MADSLIKIHTSAKIPTTHSVVLIVKPNGEVWQVSGDALGHIGQAIELQPHGKLKDYSVVWDKVHSICFRCEHAHEKDGACINCKLKDALDMVNQAPTIMEASK